MFDADTVCVKSANVEFEALSLSGGGFGRTMGRRERNVGGGRDS